MLSSLGGGQNFCLEGAAPWPPLSCGPGVVKYNHSMESESFLFRNKRHSPDVVVLDTTENQTLTMLVSMYSGSLSYCSLSLTLLLIN